jgi:hypothetical protein
MMTTSVIAIPLAYGARDGYVLSHRAIGAASVASPMAPLRMPTVVMPTCTVERKVAGSW